MNKRLKADRLDLGGHDPLRDEAGAGLPLVIRIAADGRVFVHDITADIAPVLLALAPGDTVLAARLEAARAFVRADEPVAPTTSIRESST